MSSQYPDVLVAGRVRLRPLAPSDAADHARWRNDPEVVYWATAGSPNFGPLSPIAVERWFSEKLPTLDPKVDGVLAIELLDGRHIGMVDYRDVDTIVRSATVGITVGEKDLWGHGLGTEALGLLLAHLFERLNLRRIQLDTWSGNERAIRAFTRLGFQEEGRLREAVYGPGRYYDSVVMKLLRRDWQAPAQSG